MKTIRELVDGIDYIEIEYRTCTPDGYDILTGYAEYERGRLSSLDGDCYSLDDVVSQWKFNSDMTLTVWYESRWITG